MIASGLWCRRRLTGAGATRCFSCFVASVDAHRVVLQVLGLNRPFRLGKLALLQDLSRDQPPLCPVFTRRVKLAPSPFLSMFAAPRVRPYIRPCSGSLAVTRRFRARPFAAASWACMSPFVVVPRAHAHTHEGVSISPRAFPCSWVSCPRPALPYALGSNASGFAAVALSAPPASLTLAVPPARAGATAATGYTPPSYVCINTQGFDFSRVSALWPRQQAGEGLCSSRNTGTLPNVDNAPPASCRSSSGGLKNSGRRLVAHHSEAVLTPGGFSHARVSGGDRTRGNRCPDRWLTTPRPSHGSGCARSIFAPLLPTLPLLSSSVRPPRQSRKHPAISSGSWSVDSRSMTTERCLPLVLLFAVMLLALICIAGQGDALRIGRYLKGDSRRSHPSASFAACMCHYCRCRRNRCVLRETRKDIPIHKKSDPQGGSKRSSWPLL